MATGRATHRAIVLPLAIAVAVLAVLYASFSPSSSGLSVMLSRLSKRAFSFASTNKNNNIMTSEVQSKETSTSSNMTRTRTPVYFLSHGGPTVMYNTEHPVYPVLQAIGEEITHKVKPKAVVVFSAHWQAPVPNLIQVNHAEETDLIYDFYGFPDYMYEAKYPSRGDPKLARHVIDLLTSAGIRAEGVKRGLDHGVWAGFHVAFHPTANPLTVPLVQASLFASEDPDQHYRLGHAVAALRAEGVLVVGAGMSVHNLRDFRAVLASDEPGRPLGYTVSFDEALKEAVEGPSPSPKQQQQDQDHGKVEGEGEKVEGKDGEEGMDIDKARQMRMALLCGRPDARRAHPTMDHLMPVHVAAGAAGPDPGRRLWTLHEGCLGWAQYRFGDLPGGEQGVSWEGR